MTKELRPSEVADAVGINRETLRYYERRGIIAEPHRTIGGHRLYSPETVTVLKVIKTAQRLGFTLKEAEDLLTVGGHRHGRRRADASLQARATAKLAEVEQKITDLTVIAETLRQAISTGCDDLMSCANDERCPIPFADIATSSEGAT